MFGHPNSQVLAATVSKYGFNTKNTLEYTCPNCARQFRRKKSIHQKYQRTNYNIKFEFTAPGTPQQNGKDERAFVTLYGKTRSMLNSARLTTFFSHRLWASCASLAVQLENIIVNQKKEKSASEKVYGSNPKWISNMRSFGEMAIVARHSDKKARNKFGRSWKHCHIHWLL
jgi:hypothetical protein